MTTTVETDCEDRTGLDDLQRLIERETDQLDHLRAAFPASWFSIKDTLAGMPDNYLTFERYRELCGEHGEHDAQAQERLAVYLNNLGIALNYRTDSRLRDTHVLNPEWLTNGIYQIINASSLAAQQGILHDPDLISILEPSHYPPERHSFLLELMRKFELSFRFPEDDGRYLIPGLLGKDEPAETATFETSESLNFEYHYPTLPEGLIARFIVRTHVLSSRLPRWRSGVMLAFEGNQALVRADSQDKTIRVHVAGPTPSGRRRLLAVIRSDFEHIHRSYTFTPQEMVPLPEDPEERIAYKELLTFEAKGFDILHKAIGNDVVELDVQKLLNGVDLEGTRPRPHTSDESIRSLRLFYSYSHKDEPLRDELETHLKLLQRKGIIAMWHDRHIRPGDDWKDQIDSNLEQADLILLLVSANFMASDYCYDLEMTRALERDQAGEARVIPVIIRAVNWRGAPFAHLQALPTDGRAIMLWADRDSAWLQVAEDIEALAEELRQRRRL